MQAYSDNRYGLQNNKGIALVSALLITLLLSVVIATLAYRAGVFSKSARDNVLKSQNIYTAEIGLNQFRYFLMDTSCNAPSFEVCFDNLNTNIERLAKFNDGELVEVTEDVGAIFSSANEFSLLGEKLNIDLSSSDFKLNNSSYDYKIFIKKSPIPKVLNTVIVATHKGNEKSKTIIDAGIIDTYNPDYKQAGQGRDRAGESAERIGDQADNISGNY